MKRSWLLSLLVAVALAFLNMPAFAQDSDSSSSDSMEDLNSAVGSLTSRVNALEKKGPSVEIHGFAQQDIINDSTESFTETVGDGSVKPNGTVAGDNGWTQYSLRNSRIDFLAQAVVDGWATKGYIEADFLGYVGGSAPEYGAAAAAPSASLDSEVKFYTQPTLRLRHAYLDAQNDGWEILAGQYWSLFGWNMEYVLSTVAEAPVMGTLYFRTPQLRVQKTFGDNKSMQLQVAVDAEKPDQIQSQMPNLNAGVRFLLNDVTGYFCPSTGNSKLVPLSVGLSLRNANYVWNNQPAGNFNLNANMWGSAVAADVLLPVLPAADGKNDPSIVLTGEWTAGAGDTDAFNGGGFSGATGLTGANGSLDPGIAGIAGGYYQLIQLQSWNAQIQVTLPRSIGTIFTAGYGELFSPNDGGVGAGATYNDDKCMFVNVMQDFTPNIRAGLEYASFDTHYIANFGSAAFPENDAVDNRVQLSTWYRF